MAPRIPAYILLAALVPAGAQELPIRAAPMAGTVQPAPSQLALPYIRAEYYHDLGFPSTAVDSYREALEVFEGNEAARGQLTLKLASALLDAGDVDGAEKTLNTITNHDSVWNLRAGLVAIFQKRTADAKQVLEKVKPAELTPSDTAWFYFLQGAIANREGDPNAPALYKRAADAAASEVARAQFQILEIQARIKLGQVSVSDLESARVRAATPSERANEDGYNYALELDAVDRKADAVAELLRLRNELTPRDGGWMDQTNLLLGMIAGAADPEGRTALLQLLTTGSDAEQQRTALVALAGAAKDSRSRQVFRDDLGRLIGGVPPHRILSELLLYRAEVELVEKNYVGAEKDAKDMLQRFPASKLKPQADAILASSAWEQLKFFTAEGYATKAHDESPPGQPRAALGLLAAEALFRAREFRRAADAYEAVLGERPDGLSPGSLMYQRVQAEIEAIDVNQPDAAAATAELDKLVRDPSFDADKRWQSEWNLAQKMEIAGLTVDAFARVNRLLDAAAPSEPSLSAPSLFWRMKLLQAELSLKAGQPQQTLAFASALETAKWPGVAEDIGLTLRSNAILLQARAEIALGREAEATDVFKRLREQFPKSPAAVNSYLEEAQAAEKKGLFVDAQRQLRALADNFPESPYAPIALYRAALLDKSHGQLEDANNSLENIVKRYPASEMVFTVRLTQGEILQQLGHFPQAEDTFYSIVNDYPGAAGLNDAWMRYADSLAAQANDNIDKATRAGSTYERLRSLPGLSPDMRVEAGLKWGNLRKNRDWREARDIWWSLVTDFLTNPAPGVRLGSNGRIWIARTLSELEALAASQQQPEDAQSYRKLRSQYGLPAGDIASVLKTP